MSIGSPVKKELWRWQSGLGENWAPCIIVLVFVCLSLNYLISCLYLPLVKQADVTDVDCVSALYVCACVHLCLHRCPPSHWLFNKYACHSISSQTTSQWHAWQGMQLWQMEMHTCTHARARTHTQTHLMSEVSFIGLQCPVFDLLLFFFSLLTIADWLQAVKLL